MADEMFLGGYTKEWYDGMIKGRELIYDYNMTRPSELKKRYEILKEFMGCCHEDTLIEPPFHCDEGYNFSVGKHFYANYGLTVLDYAPVTIGDYVLLGPNVTLTSATHNQDWRIRYADDISDIEGAPIVIEDHVWIGANVVVMPGVTIGKHSIIGAGSVVTKDIPPDCVAVGVPARVIKKLTED